MFILFFYLKCEKIEIRSELVLSAILLSAMRSNKNKKTSNVLFRIYGYKVLVF